MTAQDPGLLTSEELVAQVKESLEEADDCGLDWKYQGALAALAELADRLLLCEEGIRQAQATPFDDDQVEAMKATDHDWDVYCARCDNHLDENPEIAQIRRNHFHQDWCPICWDPRKQLSNKIRNRITGT